MTLKELEQKVLALEKELAKQKNSSGIPRDLETALKYRLKGIYGAGATGSYSAIRRSISLSGNAESISVLEDPAGYIPITYNNVAYKIPYFVD